MGSQSRSAGSKGRSYGKKTLNHEEGKKVLHLTRVQENGGTGKKWWRRVGQPRDGERKDRDRLFLEKSQTEGC